MDEACHDMYERLSVHIIITSSNTHHETHKRSKSSQQSLWVRFKPSCKGSLRSGGLAQVACPSRKIDQDKEWHDRPDALVAKAMVASRPAVVSERASPYYEHGCREWKVPRQSSRTRSASCTR